MADDLRPLSGFGSVDRVPKLPDVFRSVRVEVNEIGLHAVVGRTRWDGWTMPMRLLCTSISA
jgi:hypothetical protein